jgi:hypothetical protein
VHLVHQHQRNLLQAGVLQNDMAKGCSV